MSAGRTLGLRVGERVAVRPLEEILDTLDDNGCLDALPFMPEMSRSCGQEFTVLKRVDKANDLVDRTGLRRMYNAVILKGERCDGSFHGGCQALCQPIWKEAWLKRIGERAESRPREVADAMPRGGEFKTRLASLERFCQGSPIGGQETFRCQQTELKKASSYLAWWDPRQYARDWWYGNVSAGVMIRALMFWIFKLTATRVGGFRFLVAGYNRLQLLRGGKPYPYLNGSLQNTPVGKLDLRPGEWVQVKSLEEIIATLDTHNKNRGLWFDVEMARYCSGVYKVLCRVERIIEPRTGKMLRFASDCIILDDVTTQGEYHRFYPQNEYPFWREIWLRRRPEEVREDAHRPTPSRS